MSVELFRFVQRDDGPDGSLYWCAPEGCQALIDLVPPGQDADPEVNFGIGIFDEALDSDASHYRFGTANVTELQLDAVGRDAWESVTGYRPAASTVAAAIAEHLLLGSDPTGQDFTRPLTAGRSRQLDVHLGGRIWSHTLADWSDPLALPVMRVEAESLAAIYREQGELHYRLALGGLHRKYEFYGPVKHLIAWLFPSGREDLPLLDELSPQTIVTEKWPNTGGTGVITSGQDHVWSVNLGSWSVPSAGICRAPSNSRARLDYVFGSADYLATYVFRNTSSGPGILCRSDSSLANFYLALTVSADRNRLFVFVSGSSTSISAGTGGSTVFLNDVIGISAVGSSITWKYNGANNTTVTNTAVATGSYCGLYNSGNGQSDYGQAVIDDFVTGGGSNRRRRVIMSGGG